MAQAKKALVKSSKKQKVHRATAAGRAKKQPSFASPDLSKLYRRKWVDSNSGESFENINPADTAT